MKLNGKQATLVYSNEPTIILCGGFGGGKTVAGASFVIRMIAERPHECGLIFSNTSKQLNGATLYRLIAELTRYGFTRDINYVIDKNPKPFFNYNSKFADHAGIWSFQNGAQIQTFSLESMFAGIDVGWCWGDEIDEAKEKDLMTILGRVRGSKKPLQRYTCVVPEYNPFVRNWIFGERHLNRIISPTHDNQANLPDGFIEGLQRTFSTHSYDRLVLAKDVQAVERQWVYVWKDEEVRKKRLARGLVYIPGLPVYLSFDFNKDPLTCLAIQKQGQGVRILREFRLRDSNLTTICQAIATYYGYTNYFVTGDYTGKYGDNILQEKFMNYYQKIAIELKIPKHRFILRPNPPHVNSRDHVNSILEKHPDLLIDSEKCVFLIDDFNYVESLENSDIDKTKDKRRSHLLDGFAYYCHNHEREYLRGYIHYDSKLIQQQEADSPDEWATSQKDFAGG